MKGTSALLALTFLVVCSAQKIVITNDDGWATAQIRAQYTALKSAGYDVILSAPADQRSGTGSSSAPATPLEEPCEFNTCPAGSPAQGFNASDTRLNYVHSYPVDSVRYGIQTLAPKFFNSPPDFVVSGTNIGSNLGSGITGSGTVGAASEAALEGIPSVAFSGRSGSQVSYTTLSDTSASSTKAANIYTALLLNFTNTLISNPSRPILPPGISVNVNFASISSCSSASKYKFVFTRLVSSSATDVTTCGTNRLTAETDAIDEGCITTVSVFNATTKKDVGAATQKIVLDKLTPILSCL